MPPWSSLIHPAYQGDEVFPLGGAMSSSRYKSQFSSSEQNTSVVTSPLAVHTQERSCNLCAINSCKVSPIYCIMKWMSSIKYKSLLTSDGLGWVSHLWFGVDFGKFPLNTSNFSLRVKKNLFRFGQKVPRSRAGQDPSLVLTPDYFSLFTNLDIFSSDKLKTSTLFY